MPLLQIRDKDGKFVAINAINGKSAYEQAKEGGYSGTEEEFIVLLNGLTRDENGKIPPERLYISYGTTDLTAGSSSLETGKLYFVYE